MRKPSAEAQWWYARHNSMFSASDFAALVFAGNSNLCYIFNRTLLFEYDFVVKNVRWGMDAIRKNQSASGFTVLLVDDSKSIRHGTEVLLTESGLIVVSAGDGFEALCKLAAVKPDIILMDIMMPRLDGFQTCALIKQHSQFNKIPIVLMSGSDGLMDQVKAELVGAQRYIIKPFTRNDLLNAMRELIPALAGT
jgi:twitching motility two-component system response regulator PilG